MQFLNAIAACCILVGVLNLAGFLGGQLGKGSAPAESLVYGAALLAYGVLLCGVANVGIKLNRIEKHLRERADDVADPLSD